MNNPKKNKIILLTVAIIIIVSVIIYFWKVYVDRETLRKQTLEETTDPFSAGKGGGENTNFKNKTASSGIPAEERELPILRQISNIPTAGGIAFKQSDLLIIRYVDRGTGHIYETTDKSLEETKISNSTIPKVVESIWAPNGQSVIMRYIKEGTDDIFSLSANIVNATTSQDISKVLKTVFLPSNISQLVMNPSGDKIFYLINDGGESFGIISKIDGTQKKEVFKSPIKEWLALWSNTEVITLTTKPSATAPGYLFFLNSKTGTENKILGATNGLTAITSSSTKNILYSESSDDSVKLYQFDSKTGLGKTLSFKTLPEKCVWSKKDASVVYCAIPNTFPSNEYPDSWYQGLTSFTDSIWKLNTKTNSSELIFNIQRETGKEIDMTNLFLSDGDEFLFFINKKDLTFWSLALKRQEQNVNSYKNSQSF